MKETAQIKLTEQEMKQYQKGATLKIKLKKEKPKGKFRKALDRQRYLNMIERVLKVIDWKVPDDTTTPFNITKNCDQCGENLVIHFTTDFDDTLDKVRKIYNDVKWNTLIKHVCKTKKESKKEVNK